MSTPKYWQYSEVWRITGSFSTKGERWVVLANAAGAVRVDSPSMFSNDGYAQIGEIDGAKVTIWSGTSMWKSNAFSQTSVPSAQAILGEVKK